MLKVESNNKGNTVGTITSANMYCRHPSFLLFILITPVLITVPSMESLEDSIQVLLSMRQTPFSLALVPLM